MKVEERELSATCARLTGAGLALRLTAASGCMVPTIRPGDLVLIHPVGARPLAAGDVVAFRRGEQVVVHRLVGVATSGEWQTRGDAEAGEGVPVKGEDVVGRVEGLERGGKRLPLTPWLAARAYGTLRRWAGRVSRRVGLR